MGFYDCTCTITGVSLIDDATCVLLRLRDGRFSPVTLPVRGGYDRQGAVDGIEENRESKHRANGGLLRCAASGGPIFRRG